MNIFHKKARRLLLVFLCSATLLGSMLMIQFSNLAEAAPTAIDCSTSTDVTQGECEALVALYDSTNGDSWSNSSSWKVISNTVDVCNWHGIFCSGGGVESIFLENNNMSGTLPAEFTNLVNLKYLDFDRNSLNGPLPANIGNMTELIEFSATLNSFSGSLPSGLGDLQNLQDLDLSSNEFSGEIPVNLGNTSKLEELSLGINNLTGTIPSSIGNLTRLQSLNLSTNRLVGEIPATLGNLTSTYEVYLSENMLTGSIPSELGNMSSLSNLHLDQNQLSGTIPNELGNLSFLTNLYLDQNQLSGAIPNELGDIPFLFRLILSDNQLSDEIPADLGDLTNLRHLSLSNNQLTGEIPSGLGNLANLESLYINSNPISGSIPVSISDLSNLEYLIVNSTLLTGQIPVEIIDLGQLGAFDFYETDLCKPQSVPFDMWLFDVENRFSGLYKEVNGTGLVCGQGTGMITGTVTNVNDQPLANIDVYAHRLIDGQINTVTMTTTNSSGIYQLAELGSGGIDYYIYAVDPTETLTPTYHANSKTITNATAANVSLGNTTANIDIIIGELPNFELQVSLLGDGNGSVSSNPSGINCNSDCTESYPENTVVTLTAQFGFDDFAGWGGACSGTGYCVVTMDEAKNVTATFNQPPTVFDITVTLFGDGDGSVTSDPAGISCNFDCTESYPENTVVTLTAQAGFGDFSGWGGACSGTGQCVVTMDEAKNVTATFDQPPTLFDVTVTVLSSGVSVTSSPSGMNCPGSCGIAFDFGTTVTLNAITSNGFEIESWGGDCSGTELTCVLTMDDFKTVTIKARPIVEEQDYILSVAKDGSGTGTVTSSPSGIDCGSDCVEILGDGDLIELSATPADGSSFTGWAGGACSGLTSCAISISDDTTVTATFTADPEPIAVLIKKAGTGTGQVIGTSVNIDCGTSCDAMIDSGTPITLTATADDGSEFIGWSGGNCSGTDICSLTVTETQTITATFDDVAQPTFPEAPLLQPPDNQEVEGARPTFSWNSAVDGQSGVVSYTVTATRTQAVRTIAESPISYTFTTTETMITPQFDLPAGSYEWTVDAYDAAGNAQRAGEVRRFSVSYTIYLPLVTRP